MCVAFLCESVLNSFSFSIKKIVGEIFKTLRTETCLFVLLLYVPSQQLWSWRDGQFTVPHFFLGKLKQAVNQYFVHILSLVTDHNPS